MFTRRKIIIFIFVWGLLVLPLVALAQEEKDLSIQLSKMFGETVSGLPEYIARVYNYAIGLAVSLSIFMLMVGGFKWIIAAGNPGKIGDAKNTITDAIIGLILTLGAYIILSTINPAILSLKIPKIEPIKGTPWTGSLSFSSSCVKANLAGDGTEGNGCKEDDTCNTGLYCVETGTFFDVGLMEACAKEAKGIGEAIGTVGGAIVAGVGGTAIAGPVGTIAGMAAGGTVGGAVVGYIGSVAGKWKAIFMGKNKVRICTSGREGKGCGDVVDTAVKAGIKMKNEKDIKISQSQGCVPNTFVCSCLNTCVFESRKVGEPCKNDKQCPEAASSGCDAQGFFGGCGACRGKQKETESCRNHYDCLKDLTCLKPPQKVTEENIDQWAKKSDGFCVKARDATGYGVWVPDASSWDDGGTPCFEDGNCQSESQLCMQCRVKQGGKWVVKENPNLPAGQCIDCSIEENNCQGGFAQGCSRKIGSLCMTGNDCENNDEDPASQDFVNCQLPPLEIQTWIKDTLKLPVAGLCGHEVNFTKDGDPCYTNNPPECGRGLVCMKWDGSVAWDVLAKFRTGDLGYYKVYWGRCKP